MESNSNYGCMWCETLPEDHTEEQKQFCQLLHDQWRMEALQRMSK